MDFKEQPDIDLCAQATTAVTCVIKISSKTVLNNMFICFNNFFSSIARGQKIPIFSAAGLPHNDVS